ncbi:MAG: DegQ family serine endoprotease [Candidatus Margulisiibacteriota bacterium]
MPKFIVGVLVSVLAFSTVSWSQPTDNIVSDRETLRKASDAFHTAAEMGMPAVVNIGAVRVVQERALPQDPFFDLFGDEFMRRFYGRERDVKQQSLGSGVIVSKDGYILTNNHVVEKTEDITVTLSDKREFKAKVVGTDPKTDVAVLKIEAQNLPTLALGNSDAIRVGDWAIAIGSPFGLARTLTVGVISATGRSKIGLVDYENFIQTDAAINPGNSGGPLLDVDGKLIGINTAIFSRSGGYLGIGFAIPINLASKIMDDLIKNGKVVRGFLGVNIQDVSEALRKSFGLDAQTGALVSDVVVGSPAEKAGLKRGDVIITYNGVAVSDVAALRSMVAQTAVGQSATIVLIRNGKSQTVTAKITQLTGDEEAVATDVATPNRLGLTVGGITPELQKQYGLRTDEGVIVTKMDPDGVAALAGIAEGDQILEVNQKLVKTVADFNRMTSNATTTQYLLLIKRKNMAQYVIVTVK